MRISINLKNYKELEGMGANNFKIIIENALSEYMQTEKGRLMCGILNSQNDFIDVKKPVTSVNNEVATQRQEIAEKPITIDDDIMGGFLR